MDNLLDILASNLAKNVIFLRRKQGLSQSQLARKASIPRSTLTYMESGASNPSLSNLAKISGALQVSIEELVSVPQEAVKLVQAKEVRVEQKSKNKVRVEKLLPDPVPGMEIDRMTFLPGSRLKGAPHIARTKEYLYCSLGSLQVYVQGSVYTVKAGDVLAFPGDEPHAYENLSSTKKAIGFSVVVFTPQGMG